MAGRTIERIDPQRTTGDTMRPHHITVATLLTCAAFGAQAQALTEIKVSYQPALYWALPFHIATEKN
jgi:hypothetical protein